VDNRARAITGNGAAKAPANYFSQAEASTTAGASDPNEAIDFLKRAQPTGPWVITTMGIKRTTTETFMPGEEVPLRAFIASHEGMRNIYFTVNQAKGRPTEKPSKQEMRCAWFLHVDIDAPKDESNTTDQAASSVAETKARGLAALRAYHLAPTFIVDSGNGLHAYWRLDQPVMLDTPAAVEAVEARNRALARAVGGDPAVHNIDRMLRLPGTTNLPTDRKRKCGFTAAPTAVIEATDAAYPLSAFPMDDGADTRTNGHGAGLIKANGHRTIDASVGLEDSRPVDVESLPVSDRIKRMILTGEDIDDPATPYADRRSERDFGVLVAMAGAGCDDRTMAAVMLDETLPIGAHVRDQHNIRRYLARQIERARDRAADPAVAELNEKYAFVIAGDRAAVLEEIETDLRRFRLLPVSTFKLALENRTVEAGEKPVKLAKYWLEHPRRRQYEDIVFAPGRDVPSVYNLWRGFAVEPRAGDCSKFLAHLRDNVCGRNEDHYRWVVAWFADIVQNPARKSGTSLVLRGRQGVGKTIVGQIVGSLLGQHYVLVADPRYVTGRFNSHLVDCLLLHADEGFWAGDRAAEGKLKDLVTGRDHLIEFKGKEPFRVCNHVRLFVTSNSDWVVPAGMEERRFAVLDVGEDHMQDKPYFAAIDAEMDAGGREALLDFLLNYDLRDIDLRTIPKTAALAEQKVSSLTPEQSWWLDVLSSAELPGGCDGAGRCPTKNLFEHCVEHAKQRGFNRRVSKTALGIFLHKHVPGLRKDKGVRYRTADGRQATGSVYVCPPLPECRAEFSKTMQWLMDEWDELEEWRAEPVPEPGWEDGRM
jgi:hypothetical protein